MCKLYVKADLKLMRTGELHALFNRVGGELIRSAPDTCQRRSALANLDSIRTELRHRAFQHRP